LRVISPDFVPPEWIMISLIAVLFAWGFSKRNDREPIESDPIQSDKLPWHSPLPTSQPLTDHWKENP
jgi:hypothetical protein